MDAKTAQNQAWLFVVACAIVAALCGGMLWSSSRRAEQDAVAIREALDYLHQTPNVAWFQVGQSEVVIGFTDSDWQLITRGASLNASRAIDGRYRAVAVSADQRKRYGQMQARSGFPAD